MQPQPETLHVSHQLLVALAAFDYLTPSQAARLLQKETSLTYIRETFRSLAAEKLVLSLEGRSVTMPRVYTLTAKGREYASVLWKPTTGRRFRPSDERDKIRNPYFLRHTLAITDVLIAARLLAKSTPGITLARMYTERALQRRISVAIPEQRANGGKPEFRQICLEPDAGLLFRITESWHTPPETWEDFFFLEVYRNLPPQEWRFKQKVQGFIAAVDTGQQQALFQTPALSIAVITVAESEQMAVTLKRWTEEALREIGRGEEGMRFFFRNLAATASASPEELYLMPVWEQAFSTAKTPLLALE
jgi:Replication-relaxation